MRLRPLAFSAILVASPLCAQTQIAELGQCPLELGGVVENCRLAYCTFGKYDANRGNAILIPTWFASRADDWLRLLGPSGVVDTAGVYVVVMESLGASSSSSPTTSQTQRTRCAHVHGAILLDPPQLNATR